MKISAGTQVGRDSRGYLRGSSAPCPFELALRNEPVVCSAECRVPFALTLQKLWETFPVALEA